MDGDCWRFVDNFACFDHELGNSLINPYRHGPSGQYIRSCPEGPTDRECEEAGACIGGLGPTDEWFLRAFCYARHRRVADRPAPPASVGEGSAWVYNPDPGQLTATAWRAPSAKSNTKMLYGPARVHTTGPQKRAMSSPYFAE